MSKHRDHDPGGLGFLDDMIEAVRSEEPAESEWRDARGKLSNLIQKRKKESPIMKMIRKTRSTRLGWAVSTAALAVVILLALGIVPWGRRPALAFADVLAQIRTARPYACTSTTEYKGKPAHTIKIIRLDLSRRREIRPDGTVLVFDLSQEPNRTLILMPDRKVAVEKTLTGVGPREDPDLLTMLVEMRAGSAEDLGTREINGRTARGFHLPDETNEITIWADSESGLPVRFELVQPRIERKITMTDFRFHGGFDESLFSTTAPEGYKVTRVAKDGTTPTEEDLIEGLRAVAEFLDGRFPPLLSSAGLRKAVLGHAGEDAPALSEEERSVLGEKIQRAVRYTQILETFRKAEDLHYSGEGVRLGDEDSPVFRWLPKDSKAYRVVFGDLSVRDVPKDKVDAWAEK